MIAETAIARNTAPTEIRKVNIDLLLSATKGTMKQMQTWWVTALKRFTPSARSAPNGQACRLG
jgi:hypothetical protein